METGQPIAGTVVIALVAAVTAVALDQSVKTLVTARLPAGKLYGQPGMGLRRVANRRLSAVPLADWSAVAVWAAAVLGTAVAIAGLSLSGATALGLGLSIGGATGNGIDRFARGAVIDFIVVGRWPTFNLADAALVTGAALAVIGIL